MANREKMPDILHLKMQQEQSKITDLDQQHELNNITAGSLSSTQHSLSSYPQEHESSSMGRKIYLNIKPEMKMSLVGLHSFNRFSQQDNTVLPYKENQLLSLSVPEHNKTDTRCNKMYINPRFLGNSSFQTNVNMKPGESVQAVTVKSSVHVNPKVFGHIMKSNIQNDLVFDRPETVVTDQIQTNAGLSKMTAKVPTVESSKYIYCSKTKLVKQNAGQQISTNVMKPSGSSLQIVPKKSFLESSGPLMTVSRTKLVRAPLKSTRDQSMSLPKNFSPVTNKLTRKPSFNSEVINVSRMKLVRVPLKQRKTNIHERNSLNSVPYTTTKFKRSRLQSTSPSLISISKTKLVRSPAKLRKSSSVTNTSFIVGSVRNKATRKQCISPSLVSVSRTKLIRSPIKPRRPSSSSSIVKQKESGKSFLSPNMAYSRSRKSSTKVSPVPVAVKVARAICSKYKLNKTPASKSGLRYSINRTSWTRNSRFKIDRRTEKLPKRLKKVNKYSLRYSVQKNESNKVYSRYRRPSYSVSRFKFGNMTWSKSLRPRKVTVMNKKLMRIGSSPVHRNNKEGRKTRQSLCLVQIGGVLYKTSKLKLTKTQTDNKASSVVNQDNSKFKKYKMGSSLVVSVRGNKFLMDTAGKKLVKLSQKQFTTNQKNCSPVKRIDIGGVTFIQKSKNVLIRTNTHTARSVVSQAKQKSIAMLTNKLRKSNQPCMFFHRFGKCTRKENGTCPYTHDPKQVAICKKFLQGCCEMNCTLSHDVGPEKMPTCKYFLEGCCVRDNCPYLHVKVNEKAAICKDFLSGYCPDGNECRKRHTFLCPDFDKTGNCPKGKYCQYPHKTVAKKKTKKRIVAKKKEHKAPVPKERKRYYDTVENLTEQKTEEICENQPVDNNGIQSENLPTNTLGVGSDLETKRLKLLKKVNDMKRNWLIAQSGAEISLPILAGTETESVHEPEIKRPKLGRLPSYIPLDSE